jgi:hypothetical protein
VLVPGGNALGVRQLAERQHDGRRAKAGPNDYLQRWAVSKRVNSSKADKDDATLIESMKQAA